MNHLNFSPKWVLIFLLSFAASSCNISQESANQSQSNQSQIVKPEVKQKATPTVNVTAKATITLTPAPDHWQTDNHIHNLAVDSHNPNRIYAATHQGIFLRDEAGKWFQVGTNRSDFMSFIADAVDQSKFYGSGHPTTGGNLGFVVSEDGGENWQQKSLPGVDFHGLAMSPSQPNLFYGWIASSSDGKQGLFLSADSGQTWQQQQGNGLGEHPLSLVVDPVDSKRLFAPTRAGIYQSKDGGNNWQLIPTIPNAPIVGLLLVKEATQVIMYGYRVADGNSGIVKSTDYGQHWELISAKIEGIILHLVSAPSQPEIFYAVNDHNLIFKSVDRGQTWIQLN